MSEQEPSTKVSRAERFELVDNTGKVRAALSPDDNGGTSLKFNDHEGRERAVVGVDAAGHPSLTLLNEEKRIQVALAFKAKGGVGLILFDKNGTRRASLDLAFDERPELMLNDNHGEPRAVLSLMASASEEDEEPTLLLISEDLKKGREITSQKDSHQVMVEISGGKSE